MRTIILFFTLMLSSLAGQAQNIALTFSGTSAAIRIDSVTATNLATDESIKIPGNETLLLTPKTGIPAITGNAFHGMIFPNPFSGTTTLIAGVTESQFVYLRVQNLVGQVVSQAKAFVQPGENEFILSVSAEGIYLVSLTTNQGATCFKIICTGSSGSGNRIQNLGSGSLNPNNDNNLKPICTDAYMRPYQSGRKYASRQTTDNRQPTTLKTLHSSYTLGYSAGDTIRYLCRSGNFTAIFTDSPLESKNYEVAFAPIANFTINPGEGTTETKIVMDASGCADAETPADDLEVRWDLDGDGIWDTDYDMNKYSGFQFQWAGSWSVILEVRDVDGLTDTESVTVNIAASPEGTFTDPRDRNKYPYKTIGTQVWMTRDLAWLPEVSPPTAGNNTDKFYYVLSYNGTSVLDAKATSNYQTYGVLYSGVAAKEACPEGWHTASDLEWKIMEQYLGMNDADLNVNANSFRNSGNVGGQLKETGTGHWLEPNTGATNSTGFNAIGGACRYTSSGWGDVKFAALYWTSTSGGTGQTWQRCLAYNEAGVLRYNEYNGYGMSVRCIRDATNTPPTAAFTVNPAEGTTEDIFVLDASGSSDAETLKSDLEVRWDFDGDGAWDTDFDKSKIVNHQYSLAKSYPARLEVKDAGGLTDLQAKTVTVTYATFTDSRDGNVYPYKTIGTLVWMIKNLAWLPAVSPSSEESNTEKLYYVYGYNGTNVAEAKQSSLYSVYGVLYNGIAARDACPAGWHSATDEEWKALEKLLGMSDADLDHIGENRNSGGVGNKLKEEGRSHWTSNPPGNKNPVGFTALPGGCRIDDGTFGLAGAMAHFWSATSFTTITSWYRWFAGSGVNRWNETNEWGASVRCILN